MVTVDFLIGAIVGIMVTQAIMIAMNYTIVKRND